MRRLTRYSSRWVFPLAAIFLSAAVFLRGIIMFRDSSYFAWILAILFVWLILASSESEISRRLPRYFPFYLVSQTALVFLLLNLPEFPDFYATLLTVLSMQAMLRLDPRVVAAWIGLCALAMVPVFLRTYQAQAIPLALLYTAGGVLLGSYALATRRAQEARQQNQMLSQQLEDANRQLTSYAGRLKEMETARERARLARDLHDSVTQTVFSMSLAAQSAGLLLNRDPVKVTPQLQRLGLLTRSALSEMKLLISELQPSDSGEGGLKAALSTYVHSPVLPPDLAVSFQSEGNGKLEPKEEQVLFRIVQEALNNVVKHSQSTQATLRLHLLEPFWIEIEDGGRGFDLSRSLAGSGVGLKSMYERAAEIGWTVEIISSPGSGTRVRIDKNPTRREEL